jgi:hypothetical protein
MTNFITYQSTENLDSVQAVKEINTETDLINNAILQQSQQPDSLNMNSDSVVNLLSNDTDFVSVFGRGGMEYFNESVQNETNLPIMIRNNQNSDWMTIVLLLALILLVSVRAGFQKYIGTLFQSVVNYSTSFRMFREKNYSFLHGAFRLEVLYYIIFSVFIYQILTLQHIEDTNHGLLFFGKTVAVIIIYFLVKKTAYWFLGILFKSDSETSEFLFNLDNNNRAVSIILFPIVALIAYAPFGNPGYIVIFGIITAGIFYLMLLRRGVIILLKKQFSIFYLFLYLCTLEFLPLLLIYKVVVE